MGLQKLVSKLVKADPDNYTLTLMAAAEKGSGATDSIVREWLAKAVYAPKSFAWICKNCDFPMIFGFQNGAKIEENMLKMRCSKTMLS